MSAEGSAVPSSEQNTPVAKWLHDAARLQPRRKVIRRRPAPPGPCPGGFPAVLRPFFLPCGLHRRRAHARCRRRAVCALSPVSTAHSTRCGVGDSVAINPLTNARDSIQMGQRCGGGVASVSVFGQILKIGRESKALRRHEGAMVHPLLSCRISGRRGWRKEPVNTIFSVCSQPDHKIAYHRGTIPQERELKRTGCGMTRATG